MFLTEPDARYLKSYIELCIDFKRNALEGFFLNKYSVDDLEQMLADEGECRAILSELEANTRVEASNSLVPCSQFWLIANDEVIGAGDIRHCLTPALEFFGGHISYGVKVGHWGKGLGATLLSELLKQAQKLGIKTALLTCSDTNVASQRVIEKNSGVWLDTVAQEVSGEKRLGRRYLVDTGLVFGEGAFSNNHAMIYQTIGDRRLMLVPCKALAEDDNIVSYFFDILSTGDNIGWIVFRLASNEAWLYYDGNIGYLINQGHRGKGYAEKACRLLGEKLKRLGIPRTVITCDMDNTSSRRICQKLGAKFLEIAAYDCDVGKKIKCRYIWTM